MINNLILVGRLADDPKIRQVSENVKVCNIVLAVNRPFRDLSTGEYGVDFIPIGLWNGISRVAAEFCAKGDTIGIKGRIITRCKEENGVNKYYTEIIGERISLINVKNPKDGLKMSNDDFQVDDNLDDENLN